MSEQPRQPIDPETWLREQDERIERLREQADRAAQALNSSQVTLSSRDQAVTVTVTPGGVLQEVRFSPRAESLTMAQLSAKLMETYGRACAKAASNSMSMMAGLFGENSEAMNAMRESMPSFEADDEEDDDRSEGQGSGFGAPERF